MTFSLARRRPRARHVRGSPPTRKPGTAAVLRLGARRRGPDLAAPAPSSSGRPAA